MPDLYYSIGSSYPGQVSLANHGVYDPRARLHKPMQVLARRGDWKLVSAWNGDSYDYLASHPTHGEFHLRARDESVARTQWRRMLDEMGVGPSEA